MNLHKKNIVDIILVVVINILSISLIFLITELGYRVYCDGVQRTLANVNCLFSKAPYSNLGAHNQVINDDIIGYRLNPDQEGINSLSMKEKEISVPKPKGIYRIVFLGDSLSWDRPGLVSYTAQMLGRYTNIEVLNASVPGYTTYQEMMFLKKYVIKTSPDLVILIYCLNDNHKFLHYFDSSGGMLWTTEAAESLKINSRLDMFISKSYLLSKLKLILIGKRQRVHRSKFEWEGQYDFNIAWKDYSWARFEQYLTEIKKILNFKNSKLCVVAIPYRPQLNASLLVQDYDYVLKPQKKLGGICEKYGLPYLDLFLPIYSSASNGVDLYRDNLHLNEKGQRLAARRIYHFLYRNHLLSVI